MAILTIADLLEASDHEIESCLERVTVVEDLYKYLAWLNSSDGGIVTGQFELGHMKNDRGHGLHPSALAKTNVCALKHYLDATGEIESDEVHDSKKQLIFDVGSVLHAMLQTMLEDMYGDQFEAEVSLKSKRLIINSKTDGRFSAPWYRFLVEIKTIREGGSAGFERVAVKPMMANVRQLMTYMRVDDCPFGLLLYFNKNSSDIKEHPVVWDEDVWLEVQDEVLPIVEAVRGKNRPTPKVGGHCNDCGYLHGCKFGKEHVSGQRAKKRAIRAAAGSS